MLSVEKFLISSVPRQFNVLYSASWMWQSEFRGVSLLSASFNVRPRFNRLHRKEIPDIIIVLLLVGMEPSVSQEVKLQISRSIHIVCQSLGQGNVVEADVVCSTQWMI